MRPRPIVCTAIVMFMALVQVAGASAQSTPVATPAATAFGITFPAEDSLPREMDVITDGSRTLDDVVANFVDPKDAAELFEEWEWQANHVRGYHVPSGTELEPDEIDGIYISIHQFGDASSAEDALDFIVAAHVQGSDLEDRQVDGLGDYAHEIYGEMPYGNEVTWYVQVDDLVIRFSASAPEGDPRGEAEPLLQEMLDQS
jgi:hypothetical protein